MPEEYGSNSSDVTIRKNKEYTNDMIHQFDNSTQTRWDRGEFKVQLNQFNNPRPIGFCDGSPEDVAELLSIAEEEGADDVEIDKKILKSGREIWTLGGQGNPEA
jgi:hypothetical protein